MSQSHSFLQIFLFQHFHRTRGSSKDADHLHNSTKCSFCSTFWKGLQLSMLPESTSSCDLGGMSGINEHLAVLF